LIEITGLGYPVMPEVCPIIAHPPRGPQSRRQTLLGLVVFAVLAAVALGLCSAQRRFNPAVLNYLRGAADAGRPSAPAAALLDLPEGMSPASPPEQFDRETLSDKINGKAELYLSAGFIRLECQRMALAGRPEDWVEAFVFDMGSAQNAYAVFSLQRRSDATPLDLAEFAYRAENALFLAQGSFYLELIASNKTPRLLDALEALARGFVASRPAGGTRIAERDLFPRPGLAEASIRLIPADAFGLAGLDRVFTATYAAGGGELTAFLSRRDSPQEAADRARSYVGFLEAYGGEVSHVDAPVAGTAVIAILDMYEVVFSLGPFLAGVHEAPGREEALALAGQLAGRIREVPRVP
jgi:hypothetical protein